MTIVVGITGGIGAGKSTVTDYLINQKLSVHDSDKEVRKMYSKPSKRFLILLNKIGLEKAVVGKAINKKKITEVIFRTPDVKKNLEKYIHGQVRLKRESFIKQAKKNKNKIIFIDVPLLLENKLDKEFNKILCIISKRGNRYKRIKSSRKISKKHFMMIVKNQTTDVERIKRSDKVIYNNFSKKDLFLNVKKFLRSLDK